MRQRRGAEPIRPEESSNHSSGLGDVVHESLEWGGEDNDDLFGQRDEMVGQDEVIELEEEEEEEEEK